MGSGSFVSGKVTNVLLDDERVMRLAFKILDFSSRRLIKGKSVLSREEIAVEYWALRFAVLFLERGGVVCFDNVADGDAHFKEIIDKLRSSDE